MLINKPYLVISILTKNTKLPLTFDNALFFTFVNIFSSVCYSTGYLSSNSSMISKTNVKKNIFKLFYMPVRANLAISKKSLFFYNPVYSTFFLKEFTTNTSRMFTLFYEMGFSSKKIIFFSLKKELVNLSTLLTHVTFSGTHASLVFKVLYVLTNKKLKTKKKKLKRILKRLLAHTVFFISLPRSKKFIKYIKDTNLLTIGLTNSNLFDLNIPVANN